MVKAHCNDMSIKDTKDMENKVASLSTLCPPAGGFKAGKRRLGIGEGSGNGKTCGKGHKGQRSRSGYSRKAGFEGGQMPLHRRLPKVGFTSRKKVRGVNTFGLVPLESLLAIEEGTEFTIDKIRSLGLVRGKDSQFKILGGVEKVTKKLKVEAHAISKSAREAIEKAGGKVELV